MKTRIFGKTGWQVSEIGFGAWAIGGSHWGEQSDADSVSALNKAIDLGINFIDTAAVYGNSEKIIAEIIKSRKERVYIATKIPPQRGPWPPSPYCKVEERYNSKYIEKNVEERLKNLQTDCIDLVQIHTWTRAWNKNPSPLITLKKLQKEGKIRAIGISTPEHDQNAVISLMTSGLVDSIQIIYNIFEQEPAAELLPVAKETNTAVIVRVAFDEGILTGKYSSTHHFPENDFRSRYFEGDRLYRAVSRVEKIRKEALEEGVLNFFSMSEIALKFVLAHSAVSTVIPGIRNCAQATENAKISDKPPLSDTFIKKLYKHRWLRAYWYSGK